MAEIRKARTTCTEQLRPNSEHHLRASQRLEKLAAIIRRLKPVDREIMVLYLEGSQPAEIADIVGISPNNVAQKIHRAKKVLRDCFPSRGEHTDA